MTRAGMAADDRMCNVTGVARGSTRVHGNTCNSSSALAPRVAPSSLCLGRHVDERQRDLRVERGEGDEAGGVKARQPQLCAHEVDVERVGERVDEPEEKEERAELGEQRRGQRALLCDVEGGEEAHERLPCVVLRPLDPLDPRRARGPRSRARRLLRPPALRLVALGCHRGEALECDDREHGRQNRHRCHHEHGHLIGRNWKRLDRHH
mmetsp:Transcript_26833/g.80117  ORF Transcript_26833/g.80117 Transcript_26833/m.80117 type:complete len:208 (-) Transcript_26833:205-828(-)